MKDYAPKNYRTESSGLIRAVILTVIMGFMVAYALASMV